MKKLFFALSVAILSFTAVNVAAAGDFCSDPGFVRDRENGLFAFTPGNSWAYLPNENRTRIYAARKEYGNTVLMFRDVQGVDFDIGFGGFSATAEYTGKWKPVLRQQEMVLLADGKVMFSFWEGDTPILSPQGDSGCILLLEVDDGELTADRYPIYEVDFSTEDRFEIAGKWSEPDD